MSPSFREPEKEPSPSWLVDLVSLLLAVILIAVTVAICYGIVFMISNMFQLFQ